MFKKVLKEFLITWFRTFFLILIFPKILFILFPKENQSPVIFPPLWAWILFFILISIDSFMKVYTDNKNWPWKKK